MFGEMQIPVRFTISGVLESYPVGKHDANVQGQYVILKLKSAKIRISNVPYLLIYRKYPQLYSTYLKKERNGLQRSA